VLLVLFYFGVSFINSILSAFLKGSLTYLAGSFGAPFRTLFLSTSSTLGFDTFAFT